MVLGVVVRLIGTVPALNTRSRRAVTPKVLDSPPTNGTRARLPRSMLHRMNDMTSKHTNDGHSPRGNGVVIYIRFVKRACVPVPIVT